MWRPQIKVASIEFACMGYMIILANPQVRRQKFNYNLDIVICLVGAMIEFLHGKQSIEGSNAGHLKDFAFKLWIKSNLIVINSATLGVKRSWNFHWKYNQ